MKNDFDFQLAFIFGGVVGLMLGMLLVVGTYHYAYREDAIKCIEAGDTWNNHYNHCFKGSE